MHTTFSILVIIGLIVLVIYIFIDRIDKKKNPPLTLDELKEKIVDEVVLENDETINNRINSYISTLALKKNQLIYKDDYGDTIEEDWDKEENKFIENKMNDISQRMFLSAIEKVDSTYKEYIDDNYRNNLEMYFNGVFHNVLIIMIDNAINDFDLNLSTKGIKAGESTIEYNLIDPILFEKSVADNFNALGWESKETKITGDQGADVIAEKDGIKIIVQCKLYSKPIGNKAVQEVFAAQKFYRGNRALVVSNASYTKSAQKLAESNDVILLHYTNLSKFLKEL